MSRTNSSHKPSPIVFCVLAVLLGYFAINVMQTVAEGHNHQDRVVVIEQQIESLKAKKQSLMKDIEKVKSESFIEAEARNKLNMAKENEVVVIFPQQSSVLSAKQQTSTVTQIQKSHSLGYVDEWYKLFFK